MVVRLYKNNSAANVVDKNLTGEITYIRISLKEPNAVEMPSLLLSGSDLKDINYMYIPDFGRYYFCSVTSEDGMWRVNGEVDVLMSYKTQIRALFATVVRQADKANSYLHDDYTMLDAYRLIGTRSFPQGFSTNNDSYILMTLGRGVS